MKIGKFVSLSSILLSLICLLFIPSVASAQVSINKFYSQGTYKNKPLDWVEIVNNSSSQINLKNYSIKDSTLSETNTYNFENDTYLDAGQSCVKEIGQILNKDQDIIYIFSGGSQIFCLEYGSSVSDCNQSDEIGTSPDKPVAECVSESPPVSTTNPTKAPTQSPAKTPTPTVKPSPTPTLEPENNDEALISDSTASPGVLSISTKSTKNSESSQDPLEAKQAEEGEQNDQPKSNYLAYLLIAAGIGVSGYDIFLLHNKLKGKYNEGYGKFEED